MKTVILAMLCVCFGIFCDSANCSLAVEQEGKWVRLISPPRPLEEDDDAQPSAPRLTPFDFSANLISNDENERHNEQPQASSDVYPSAPSSMRNVTSAVRGATVVELGQLSLHDDSNSDRTSHARTNRRLDDERPSRCKRFCDSEDSIFCCCFCAVDWAWSLSVSGMVYCIIAGVSGEIVVPAAAIMGALCGVSSVAIPVGVLCYCKHSR